MPEEVQPFASDSKRLNRLVSAVEAHYSMLFKLAKRKLLPVEPRDRDEDEDDRDLNEGADETSLALDYDSNNTGGTSYQTEDSTPVDKSSRKRDKESRKKDKRRESRDIRQSASMSSSVLAPEHDETPTSFLAATGGSNRVSGYQSSTMFGGSTRRANALLEPDSDEDIFPSHDKKDANIFDSDDDIF